MKIKSTSQQPNLKILHLFGLNLYRLPPTQISEYVTDKQDGPKVSFQFNILKTRLFVKKS
jgi:hypothetical protein